MGNATRSSGLLAVVLAGCATDSDPLVGTWQAEPVASQVGQSASAVLTLDANGAATATYVGTGMCSGELDFTGFRWQTQTSDGFPSIYLTGAPDCSGAITCATSSITCANALPPPLACNYDLTSGNNVLDIHGCAYNDLLLDQMYTRQ